MCLSVFLATKEGTTCGRQLSCSHSCGLTKHHRAACYCTNLCGVGLKCGHNCNKTCSSKHQHDAPCQQRCSQVCLHGRKCKLPCWAPCLPCKKPCPIKCKHSSCSKTCGDYVGCEMPRGCIEPCSKTCDKCGTQCIGLCSHECPPCPFCQPFSCPISLHDFVDLNHRAYKLVDCGCSFDLDSLDQYVQVLTKMKDNLSILTCPVCHVPIQNSFRYGTEIRTLLYKNVPEKAGYSKISIDDLQMVVGTMSATDKSHVHRNHWFQCPAGHPFYVGDCGMPREAGWCVECHAKIGSENGHLFSRPWKSEFNSNTALNV